MKKRLAAWALLACALLTLTGCGEEFRNYRPIEDVNALDGRKIGVNLAWASDYVLSPREGKDLVLYRYDDTASMLMALFYHQIDALCCDAFGWLTLEYTNGEHLHRVEEPVATDGFMNFVTPAREDLRDKFNEFLVYYHETEEFADLYERMTNFDGVHYVPGAINHPNGNGEKIRVAFAAEYFPNCYVEADGTYCGYDLEILRAFADYCNYDMELVATSYTDMNYGILTGRYEMGTGAIYDSYRSESERVGIYVTDMYYDIPLYLVELKEGGSLTIGDEFFFNDEE